MQQVRHVREERSRRGRARPLLAAVGILTALLAVGAIGGEQITFRALDASLGQLPPAHQLAADSLLFDRNGKLLAEVHPPGDTRLPVSLDRISPLLSQATVAIEDRNFWQEGATNPSRMVAAAFQNLQHGNAGQGASTITQQLAKVLYLDDTKTFDRKVRELFIARTLDTTMTKREILLAYLNDIYYGHGATGSEAASRVYFGRNAHDLDLAQAAMVAGLPNQPTDLDPFRHPEAARRRQAAVLQAMVEAGDITAEQAAAARLEPIQLASGTLNDQNRFPAFTDRVISEVKDVLHLDARTAGLNITTTLDADSQELAQRTITEQVDRVADLHVTDGAMVSVDPRSGDVVAYVGNAGAGHPGNQIDMASRPRQPGSTFKIFTYSAAVASRMMTATSPVLDGPFSLPTGGGPLGLEPYRVTNYDLRYHGVLPAQQALGNSFNVPAVKVELLAGVANVVDFARSLGITTLDQPSASYGPSLTLGGYEVPLWQMAQAGSVFAGGGVLHPAHFVRSASRSNTEQNIWPAPPGGRQVIDPGLAFIMNHVLSDDSNRLMEFGANGELTLPDHQVAAKTGTTQNFRDNLTVGWTPKLATATWVGNADNTPMQGTTGITGAAPAWNAFMSRVLNGVADDWPAMPANVHSGFFGRRSTYYLPDTGPGGPASGPCSGFQRPARGFFPAPNRPQACPLTTGWYSGFSPPPRYQSGATG